MKIFTALAFFFCFSVSCSHFSKPRTKKEILKNMAFSAVIGSVYGASFPESRKQNAFLFSSVFTAGAGVWSLSRFDESQEVVSLRKQLQEIKDKKGLSFLGKDKRLLKKGKTSFYRKGLPKHLKHLVVSGEWSLYELSEDAGGEEWVQVGPMRVLRKNQILEIKPAKINPFLRKEFIE